MSLKKYWEKRDFSITPEPRGEQASTGPRLGYVIQKHDATRLHYDFRLELEGTFKSWAIPKGPSLDPAEKRLAVHVEDHPLAYGTFEGTIPAKQYGAGTVLLWDYGYWYPRGDAGAGYRKGHLKFELRGKKLHGSWALVRMHGRGDEKQDNWLLIKEDDEAARHGSGDEVVARNTASVVSGREIDEIARDGAKAAAVENAAETAIAAEAKPKATRGKRSKAEAASKPDSAPLPDFIEPQLATLVESAPHGEGWLSEVKYDGYRILCRLQDGQTQLFTRQRNDWTTRIPPLASAIAALPARQAWLDGELLALDNKGRPSFQALQQAFDKPSSTRWIYYAFDLVFLDGHDLRPLPLHERKALLAELLAAAPPAPQGLQLLYSDHIEGETDTVFAHACQHQLEGIIIKRADAPYSAGRNRHWLKVKCQRRQEFVIGGYTEPQGSRQGFGALLLGFYDRQGALHYAGRVGTGFDEKLLRRLSRWLQEHEVEQPAYIAPPRGMAARDVHWVQPLKVAEVRFAEWTDEGVLRQASFLGLREDKDARAIVREEESSMTEPDNSAPAAESSSAATGEAPAGAKGTTEPEAKSGRRNARRAAVKVAGVALSHPDRVLYPDIGLTKLDLARYYESVSDWILPHLRDRPLTLMRCPGGSGDCFFQKHMKDTMHEAVEPVEVPDKDGTDLYMMANSLAGVIGLVQMGVLELHTWGSRKGSLDEPDRMIFDLDPDPELPWNKVVEAARLTRALLGEIGLDSFLKTTGGKGLHLVIPLSAGHGWGEVKDFSHAVADHLADTLPGFFVAKAAKAARGKRIYVDYLRNARGATAIAAFSTRARPGAPVSMPIHWEELERDVRSASFTVHNAAERLRSLKQDPWMDYEKRRLKLDKTMKAIFGLPDS